MVSNQNIGRDNGCRDTHVACDVTSLIYGTKLTRIHIWQSMLLVTCSALLYTSAVTTYFIKYHF